MISKAEIDAKASEFEIHPANVQRDYVFGWLLHGIFTHNALKDRVFLKGGNALRKGYFENTRFSFDLDFGTPNEISSDELMEEFKEICSNIESRAGVTFLADEHRIGEWYPPERNIVTDLRVYDVRLYFQNFYGNADHIKIKVAIDFTRYDKVLLPLQTRALIHPYSDAGLVACDIQCMKLEEIIATKLKCLLQRQHAPDLFDYVYSIKLLGGNIDRGELVRTFVRKTIFGRNPRFVEKLLRESPLGFFREAWQTAIVCAKGVAIGIDEAISIYLSDLKSLFSIFPESLFNTFTYFSPQFRNPIMEAGRSQTCLLVTYDSKERLVEPYSLKYMQRMDGLEREYLYVYDRIGGNSGPGSKSFVADKLTAIKNTDEKFKPRWPIELSKAGETPDDHYFFDPNKPAKPLYQSRVSGYGARGPRYVYQCGFCGKQFTHSKMSGTLNAHKNKNGYSCPARVGTYVTTIW